jgi:Tol biopolymer transport system component
VSELLLLDSHGQPEKSIVEIKESVAFAWAPDSQGFAYIAGDSPAGTGALGGLHVVDLEAGETAVKNQHAIALYWSPDSRKIAYFIPHTGPTGEDQASAAETLTIELDILDVQTGDNRVLLTFQPSNRFAEMLPYFDQFSQSGTIWSPDSRNLVLSFVDADGKPGIAVVAASGNLEPRYLAEGLLGIWSWK